MREVFFQDDTLNARPQWFFQLAAAIRKAKLHKQMFFRPFRVTRGILTKEVLKQARRAGFWMIFYGVESGNQGMLDRMGKGTTIEEIERAFDLTNRAGLCSYASFMVGNEGETEEAFCDSLALAAQSVPISAALPSPLLFQETPRSNTAQKRPDTLPNWITENSAWETQSCERKPFPRPTSADSLRRAIGSSPRFPRPWLRDMRTSSDG